MSITMYTGGDISEDIFRKKYLKENETLPEWIDRVSNKNEEAKWLIENKYFLFAGRILANRGNDDNTTLANCFVLPEPEDNIESIFETARDMASIYKRGGGVGIDISKLRAKGASVNNAAKVSSGAVSFMELYDTTTRIISQEGSNRNGALMISMSVEHPDIELFITSKNDIEKINNANISVKVTDAFMEKLLDGDTDAKRVWALLCKQNWEVGDPGILFEDRIQKYHIMENFPEYRFAGTNPCLIGETLVKTDKGEVPIKNIVENGYENYSVVSYDIENKTIVADRITNAFKTKENTEVITLTFDDGSNITLTPDHRVYTENRGWIEASDLTKNDAIMGVEDNE